MVLKNRMPGHANVRSGNQDRQEEFAPVAKIIPQILFLVLGEDGKAGQRITMAAAHFRRQPPDPPASSPQLGHLLFSEL